MRCPACNGKNIAARHRYAMLYCINCNSSFTAEEGLPAAKQKKPEPRKPRKSGVIAGPVFRRGFRWGAGY